MDIPQQPFPGPPSLVASYVDGQDHPVPPTPVSPVSPPQTFQNGAQMDGYHRQASYPSPAVASSNMGKPVKRKRLAKVSNLFRTVPYFLTVCPEGLRRVPS
jgi:hypothetical protein